MGIEEERIRLAKIGIKTAPVYGLVNGGCSCGKDDAWHLEHKQKPGKHPITESNPVVYGDSARHPIKATDSVEQIKAETKKYPGHNLAIRADDNGFIFLDFDIGEGKAGLELYEELCRLFPEEMHTVTEKSGSGGIHVIFRLPSYRKLTGKFKMKYKGLEGGDAIIGNAYIVSSPSLHQSGKYEWIISPYDTPVKELPERVIQYIEDQIKLSGSSLPGQNTSTSVVDDNLEIDYLSSEAVKEILTNHNIPRMVKFGKGYFYVWSHIFGGSDFVPAGKRSDLHDVIIKILMEYDLIPEQIAQITKFLKWKKYKSDKHIRQDIHRILGKKGIDFSWGKDFRWSEQTEREETPEFELAVPNSSGEPGSRFKVLSHEAMMGNFNPYPGWLIKDWWQKKSYGIIAGPPKSMKSILSMDMAMSVASGKPFLGRYEVHETGPVIVVQNENAEWLIIDRMNKMQNAKGLGGSYKWIDDKTLEVEFPESLPIYYVNQQGFTMTNGEDTKYLEELVSEKKPALVIFDPLYLMFEGDLNSAQELSPALTWLSHLRNDFNTGIVLVHHWSKNNTKGYGQRLLGSITLYGWFENAIYTDSLDDGGTVAEEPEEDYSPADTLGGTDESNTAPKRLVIRRESRGAGNYAPIQATIDMGKTGDLIYKIAIEEYKEQKKEKKTPQKTDDVKPVILQILNDHNGYMYDSTLDIELKEKKTVGSKTLRQSLKELEEAGMISPSYDGKMKGKKIWNLNVRP